MKYEKIESITKDRAIEIFSSSDNEEIIIRTILSALYFVDDYLWITNIVKRFLGSENLNIKKTAIVCAGDIARIYKKIDREIIKVLKKCKNDTLIAGHAENALSDISIFIKVND